MGKHERKVPDGWSIGGRSDNDKSTMEDGNAEGRERRSGRVTPQARDATKRSQDADRPVGQRREDEVKKGRHAK